MFNANLNTTIDCVRYDFDADDIIDNDLFYI